MIKQARKKDIRVLIDLNKEVQNLHHKIFPRKFKPYSIANMGEVFENFLEKTNSIILIQYLDDVPVGYIMFEDKTYQETGFTFSYRSLYIHHISVNNEFQNRGVGKNLIQVVVNKAKKLNVDCLELDVWSQNEIAKDFFKSLGFKTFNEKMSLSL